MNYRIATIEDDLLIAEDVKFKLEELGHTVCGNARNYDEAIELVHQNRPEIIIADILLEDEKDGIDAINTIFEFHKCPVIYLTANSESMMVKRAMKTHPAAFLIKPFKLSEFAINIDLAMTNFQRVYSFEKVNDKITDSIFLPDQNTFIRVFKKDILFVKADGSYVEIVTESRKYQMATNLKNFHLQLKGDNFLRVSRSYLINVDYLYRINGNMVYLKFGDKEIPIILSKNLRQEVLNKFQVLRTKI